MDKKPSDEVIINGLKGATLKLDLKDGAFAVSVTDGNGTKEIEVASKNNDPIVYNRLYDLYRAGCDVKHG